MRVLVSGASGYTGSRVANALVAAGHDVHVSLRPGGASTYLDDLSSAIQRHACGDAPGELHDCVTGVAPEAVCHLAAVSEGATRPDGIRRLVDGNVRFAAELLEAAAAAGCRGAVLAGTFWQHLDGPALAPNSLYAATKIAAHAVAQYYARLRNLPATELVLFDIYGPGDRRGRLLSLFDRAADAAEPIDLTAGEQLVSPTHVEDVAAAFVRAVARTGAAPENREVASFAVQGPALLTLREMAETYEAVRGVRLNVRWGARPYPPGQVFRPHIGTPLPDWAPRYDFEAGLRQIYG